MAHQAPKLQAAKRERLGTRYSRRIRREGRVPAVVYGHQQDPLHVTLSTEDFVQHLHDGAHLVEIQHDGGASETCLIKDVQYDYLGNDIIHVDLARIDLNEEVTVTVPLELKGRDRSPGAKTPNAIVEQPIVSLEVRCLANNIPDEISVDISALELNGTVAIKDLKLPEGVKTDYNPEDIVVSIHETKEVEEAPIVAEGGAEPEVLTAKKEDGEGEAKEARGKGTKKE